MDHGHRRYFGFTGRDAEGSATPWTRSRLENHRPCHFRLLFQIASPLETIRRRKFTADAESLKQIIGERNVGGLILGLPKNMDGSEGPRSQSTRQFAENLLKKFEIPIAFWDERLSTVAIERILIDEADLSRQKRGEVVDKMAASYILQGALDLLATITP